jgi:phthiodiolone/phenolphthiodiolone dimycocerosates ketoreductase
MSRVRFGIELAASAPEMLQTATLAEDLGYDSMWMPDETIGYEMEYGPKVVLPDCLTCLTILASKTKSIRIGSSVVDALTRHPAKLAQIVASIDSASNGRFLLGLGGSEKGNHDPFGIPTDHPYRRVKEVIQVVRLLWKSSYHERVNFSGGYYNLKEAYLRIRPFRNKGPPIYVAAFGPKMLSLVGELGNGWIPFNHTPESYKTVLNGQIKQSLENAGRTLRDLDPAFTIPACISDNRKTAQKAAIQIAKTFLVWSIDNMRMLVPELSREHPGLRHTYLKTLPNMNRLVALSKKIPDNVALDTTVSGDADDCRDRIERFIDAGCRHLIFYLVAQNQSERAAMMKRLRKVISLTV